MALGKAEELPPVPVTFVTQLASNKRHAIPTMLEKSEDYLPIVDRFLGHVCTRPSPLTSVMMLEIGHEWKGLSQGKHPLTSVLKKTTRSAI
jgi:hypothetical protein